MPSDAGELAAWFESLPADELRSVFPAAIADVLSRERGCEKGTLRCVLQALLVVKARLGGEGQSAAAPDDQAATELVPGYRRKTDWNGGVKGFVLREAAEFVTVKELIERNRECKPNGLRVAVADLARAGMLEKRLRDVVVPKGCRRPVEYRRTALAERVLQAAACSSRAGICALPEASASLPSCSSAPSPSRSESPASKPIA